MKFWALVALGAALVPSAVHAAAPAYGDVNGDGAIDRADVALLARMAGGLALPNGVNPATARRNGDVAPVTDAVGGVFGDGKITADDVTRLARRVNNLEPTLPPAYVLEAATVYRTRKYDTAGAPVANSDTDNVVQAPVEETRTSGTYIVYPVRGTNASGQPTEQRLVTKRRDAQNNLVPFTDSQGRMALGATAAVFGDTTSTFDPPLVLLVFPVDSKPTWTGTTATVINGVNVPNLQYTGTVSGPETITVPAGTFSAYKVSIDYSGSAIFASATGQETYWFVPGLGPVQHGFTRRVVTPFGTQNTANPADIRLVSATIEGVTYP